MKHPVKILAILIALMTLALATPLADSAAQQGGSGTYEGPGTVVVGLDDRDSGIGLVLADNGAVACTDTDYAGGNAAGKGGICIPFAELTGDSILVEDATHGQQVAFQICVDLDGDNVCTASTENRGGCSDRVIFSHDSRTGWFFNPLSVPSGLESQFATCGSAGFPGYIVILCAGIHRDFGDTVAHTHEVTDGTITDVQTGGTPSGDFCGGPLAEKAYVVA